MTEYERMDFQHKVKGNKPSAFVSRIWENRGYEPLDNYIKQRQELLELIRDNEQIVIDKKSYDAFVEKAATAIIQALG